MDLHSLPTPCYVIDASRLRANLEIIDRVQQATGCRILLALKGFAMFRAFPIIRQYLCGATGSSVNEVRLAHEEFGGEVHAYAPAYSDRDIEELLPRVGHLVFNSVAQFRRFRGTVEQSGRKISIGLRINPEYSEVSTELYNPCRVGSRLGVLASQLSELTPPERDSLSGLHFHTMCEQNSDTLERTLERVVDRFHPFFEGLQWINFGGGHHISRPDYDVERLCRVIQQFQERFPLQVYLEPGEAIPLNAGVLMATVLDIIDNDGPIAILDTSATAHMPDVLEMPYRPDIRGAADPGERAHTYQLGGLTCLAGDVIGSYSFDQPLAIGDRLIFEDMAHYTMVKNTAFNGVRLPAIALHDPDQGTTEVVREFGYTEYRNRLS